MDIVPKWSTFPVGIRVRLDDDPPDLWSGNVSTNGEGIFVHNAIPSIRAMQAHRRLKLEYQTALGSPAIVTFDLTGLSEQLDPLSAACGWVANFPGFQENQKPIDSTHALDSVARADSVAR